jgi:mannosyltransferase OCH1-like enzyme
MIPKIIHYCWFGGKPLPKPAQKSIASWRKHYPDYEVIEWNETNYNVHKIPYISEAYNARKYAFVSDYARFDILYEYGGIYFDTDVEVIKPFDDLLDNNICFAGFEDLKYINPGSIFAGEKQTVIAKEIMDFYSKHRFIKEDGSCDLTPSPKILTNILLKYGLSQNGNYQVLKDRVFTAYPAEYFCPMDYKTGILTVTNDTYSIHHFAGTWLSKQMRQLLKEKAFLENNIKNKISKILLMKLCALKKVIMEKLNI